jgi:hypothetical protein
MDSLRANLVLPCAYILLHVHPLLGNVLVNKFREDRFLVNSPLLDYGTTDEAVFYVVRAEQRWNNGGLHPVSKQRLGKHTSA